MGVTTWGKHTVGLIFYNAARRSLGRSDVAKVRCLLDSKVKLDVAVRVSPTRRAVGG